MYNRGDLLWEEARTPAVLSRGRKIGYDGTMESISIFLRTRKYYIAAAAAAVILFAALGVVGWRSGWFPHGLPPPAPTPATSPYETPLPTGTPSGTVIPTPRPSPSAAIPYTGAPVAELRADPKIVAQISSATYQGSRRELADMAAKLAFGLNQPALWKRVAYVKHFYNDDFGARDAYEYVNRIAPTDATAFYNLAVLYGYNLREPAKAKPKFEAAIRLDPFNISFSIGFANFYIEVMRDPRAAERILLDGFGKVPTDVSITSNLGMFYRDEGNVAKAIEFYEKALASRDLSPGERAAIQAQVDQLKSQQAGG